MIWAAIEWSGVAISLGGAALVAGASPRSRRWGFGLWIGSNLLLGIFAIHAQAWGLLTMYVIFLGTSSLGWWNNRAIAPAAPDSNPILRPAAEAGA